MNKKRGIIIISIILAVFGIGLLFLFVNTFNYKQASADSGFDSSWDSGGSDHSSSSSDYSSSSSWDHDHSSSSNSNSNLPPADPKVVMVAVVILLIIGGIIFTLLYIMYKNVDKLYEGPETPRIRELTEEEKILLLKYGYSSDTIMDDIYKVYVNIQNAWAENDIDKAKNLLSDTLYNQYKGQIMTLVAKKQRNVMGNFNYIGGWIDKLVETNNGLSISATLSVSCLDYLIDIESNNVVRGNNNKINYYVYSLEFEVIKKENELVHCPNCNAEINDEGSSITCKYCGSPIVRRANSLTLSSKKMISQK